MRIQEPKRGGCLAVLGISLVVFCVAMAIYLAKPLPLPKVSLSFVGMTSRGTNVFGMISFNNVGETMVWPTGGQDIIETESGRVTNGWPNVTTSFSAVEPFSNWVKYVLLPSNTLRWQSKVHYYYFKHHNAPAEVYEKLNTSRFSSRVTGPVANLLFTGLNLLPTPNGQFGETSAWFTANGVAASTNSPNP
jgi:hypothetical protein